jgi:multidrug efflux pump subunit AcrB
MAIFGFTLNNLTLFGLVLAIGIIVGFSAATFTNAPNSAAIFLMLAPWEQRAKDPNQSSAGITRVLSGKFASILDALILVIQPPPVSGIGNAGGFRMMVEDRSGRGPQALQGPALALMSRANQTPSLSQVFTLFETSTPQFYLDIDRAKAELLGINVADVFSTLQVYLGSAYVNDFNLFGRTLRAPARAQCQRRHRAAWLVHDGAFRLVLLPGAALQSLSRCRDRWGGGSWLFPGPSNCTHGKGRGRSSAGRVRL